MPATDRSALARACAALPLLAAALLAAPQARSQGLAAYATPPRFEVQARAGETKRQVIEIHHGGREQGRFRIYTNDWEFQPDHSVKFTDSLAPGSCRPWVALERRELSLAPGAKHRFRFEVTPPEGTPPGECRFAVMIEGADPTKVQQGGLGVSVTGRLGVIVYVAVGGVKPQLAVRAHEVRKVGEETLPTLTIENTGGATGRLEGFLTAKDADGRTVEMAPEDVPILPGRSRVVALRQVAEDGKAPAPIRYPLEVKGALEWDKQRAPLDLRFAP